MVDQYGKNIKKVINIFKRAEKNRLKKGSNALPSGLQKCLL
jgi:hypothetical protein